MDARDESNEARPPAWPHVRWMIGVLRFPATTINRMDRLAARRGSPLPVIVRSVAAVLHAGIVGIAGVVGGLFLSNLAGDLPAGTGSCLPLFIVSSAACLLALAIIHAPPPRLTMARIGGEEAEEKR